MKASNETGIIYAGEVSVKLQRKKSILRGFIGKNKGGIQLFKFLAQALAGRLNAGELPTQIALGV